MKQLYAYDEAGKLLACSMYQDELLVQKTQYSYTASTITESIYYAGASEPSGSQVYNMNSKNQIASRMMQGANVLFEYNQDGSLKAQSVESNSAMRSEYTYDDKKGPMYNCAMPDWYFVATPAIAYGKIHNILSLGGMTFSYEYDNDGFPVKSKITEVSGAGAESMTFTYEYSTDKK